MGGGYTGDVTPSEAWEILEKETDALLVDVRTAAEWQFVGVPVLDGLGKEAILVEWIKFPGGAPNGDFVAQVKSAIPDGTDPAILFLCRSGQRSMGAAAALTQAGFSRCYNILDGFEGNKDADGHRGKTGGWKVAGLPWAQG
ncbi:rhodanese-like domain-containing protein [Rhodospirillaceae bacterium KN72]|uniref:Rhodanese-like domain-containing protein n=2 Tax=Pacificispira spongiicola TaxID=2729598 RepID=A0A7Y0HFP9_9PROT|nr:rhodanese-like domain-containing protein [Pacificispira spongiicola]